MSLKNAITATKAIETLENYSLSDLIGVEITRLDIENPREIQIYSDEGFWRQILSGEENWECEFLLNNLNLSEHIARVPGLYFHKDSIHFRNIDNSQIEYVSDKWTHYTPQGKSQKVLSGIGTLKLPPNTNGWRIACVSHGSNSSLGIPVLISEEVWRYFKLKEGIRISHIKAKWVQMDINWASRFPSVRGIPKGYLKIDNPNQIKTKDDIFPTIYHPYTIMEYEKSGSLLYDFVYVTVDSSDSNYKNDIRLFLEEYKYLKDRNGKYLIEPFINEPLLNESDVMYSSPEELRQTNSSSVSHLFLLTERIKSESFNYFTIEKIKEFIDNYFDLDDLKICSNEIIISPNLWYQGKKLVDESANFLQECVKKNKVEELVDNLIKYGLNRE